MLIGGRVALDGGFVSLTRWGAQWRERGFVSPRIGRRGVVGDF